MPNNIEDYKKFIDELIIESSYMIEPLETIYAGLNSNLYFAHNGNIEYESGGYTYMFMTTPCCTNIDTTEYDRLFGIPARIKKLLIRTNKNPFIAVLSNFSDAASISLPMVQMNTIDVGENRLGMRQTLPGNILQSQSSPDFSVTYQEVNSYNGLKSHTNEAYGKLIVSTLHMGWVEYINAVRMGYVYPGMPYTIHQTSKQNISERTFRRILNYVSSTYVFKILHDGETILYAGVFAGVYPKSFNSSISLAKEPDKVSFDYQAQYFDCQKIEILEDFNISSLSLNPLASTNRSMPGVRSEVSNFIPTRALTAEERIDFPHPYIYFNEDRQEYKLIVK